MDRGTGDGGYHGLAADLYDQLRGESPLPHEFDFYRGWLERHPGPALEASCGTGRILLKLLAAGLDVEGLDASTDMLELCRVKALELGVTPVLHQQLMQCVNIAGSYRTIIVPMASFMLMTKVSDARRALQLFFNHLRPEGWLLFSTYVPQSLPNGRSNWSHCGTVFNPAHGVVRVSIATEADVEAQITTDLHRFEVMNGGAVAATVVHSIHLRWYYRNEMIELLESTGFRDVRVWGNHVERDATPDDRVLVFGGCRPAE